MGRHLSDPVDSHQEEKLGGNLVVPEAGLGETVPPGPTGELDQEAAEHDEVRHQEDDDDHVEIQELRQILGQAAGDRPDPDDE